MQARLRTRLSCPQGPPPDATYPLLLWLKHQHMASALAKEPPRCDIWNIYAVKLGLRHFTVPPKSFSSLEAGNQC